MAAADVRVRMVECNAIVASLEAFKSRFFQGPRGETIVPSVLELANYLGNCPIEFSADLAVDLVSEHLRLSWQRNSPVRIETYVKSLSFIGPEFASLRELPVDLIEREFVCRHGDAPDADHPSIDDYVRQFAGREDVAMRLESLLLGNRRYVRLERLGGGGQGRVWLAWDQKLLRHVAIKQPFETGGMSPGDERRLSERWLKNEARIAARLDHPGIVTVHDINEPKRDRPCYVMRLLRGRLLSERIRDFHDHLESTKQTKSEQGRKSEHNATDVSWTDLLDAVIGVCDAMAYAHGRDVVHRDLKPSNVIVGDFHDIGVFDWGMASETAGRAGASTEQDFLGYGTPGYSPPEQLRGEVTGPAADVYSLGAILFESLTGSRPSNEHQPTERPEKWRPPKQGWSEVMKLRTLYAVCQRAMAPEPGNRYPSAKELADELRLFRATGRVNTWKGPWAARFLKWLWNRRVGVSVVAVTSLIAVASVTVGYQYAERSIPRLTSNGIWDRDPHVHVAAPQDGATGASPHTARLTRPPQFQFQDFASPFVVQRLWADPLEQDSWIHANIVKDRIEPGGTGIRKICEVTFSRRGIGCDVTFKPNDNIQAAVSGARNLVIRIRADEASLRELRSKSPRAAGYAFRVRVVDDLNHHWAWGSSFPQSVTGGEQAVLYRTVDAFGRSLILTDAEPREFEFDLTSRRSWAFWRGEGSQWTQQADHVPFTRLDLVVIEPGVAPEQIVDPQVRNKHERLLDNTPTGVVGRFYVTNIGFR